MRYAADIADAGKFKGEWVVVDRRTGALAVDRSFPNRFAAETEARNLNLMAENARLKDAIDATWRHVIEHPYGQVCKHWVVLALGEALESRGFPTTETFAKAIVSADDESALSHKSIFA